MVKKGIKRFINNFNLLDDLVKKLIAIENDDKSYNIRNVLTLYTKLNRPMVLDYHHFKVNRNNKKIEDYMKKLNI